MNASLWAPTWQLAGLLPAFLVDNFLFWRSRSDTRIIQGHPKQTGRWTSYQLRICLGLPEQGTSEARVYRTEAERQ
eukprot:COSAG01_NODE_50035_length_367_cov_0.574627_1_plen_75_part_10